MLQIHLLYTNIPKAQNAVAEHYKFPSIHYQRATVTGKVLYMEYSPAVRKVAEMTLVLLGIEKFMPSVFREMSKTKT